MLSTTAAPIQQNYITQEDLNSKPIENYGIGSAVEECDIVNTGFKLIYDKLELVPNIYNDVSYCYHYILKQNMSDWSCGNNTSSFWKQIVLNPCSKHSIHDSSALLTMWQALRPFDGKLSIFVNKDIQLNMQGLIIRNSIVEIQGSFDVSFCLKENYQMLDTGEYCIVLSNRYQSCLRYDSDNYDEYRLMVPNICNEIQ